MIGYIAGALTTKSTKDVSLLMLLCSTSGMSLWLLHGIQVKDSAIIAANRVSIILAASLLGLKLKNDYVGLVFEFNEKMWGSENKSASLRK